MNDWLRSLPSVDSLLQNPLGSGLIETFGRPLAVEAIRLVLSETRKKILSSTGATPTPIVQIDFFITFHY